MEDLLSILRVIAWPLVIAGVLLVLLWPARPSVKALVESLTRRGIKFGGAEFQPEPAAQQAAVDRIEHRLPVAEAAASRALQAPATHPFEAADAPFFKAMVDELQAGIEKINFASEDARYRWMIREGAALILNIEFERFYRVVWASQLELMGRANQGFGLTPEQARACFEYARTSLPNFDKNDTFERWSGMPLSFGMLEYSGDRLVTSAKGKVFIQYMVQHGYDLHGLYTHN